MKIFKLFLIFQIVFLSFAFSEIPNEKGFGKFAIGFELENKKIFWFELENPKNLNYIGDLNSDNPFAISFLEKDYFKLYAIDGKTNEFAFYSTIDGKRNVLGLAKTKSEDQRWVGMAEGSSNKLYAISSNCLGENYLYNINPSNREAKVLGEIKGKICLKNLFKSPSGKLYSIDTYLNDLIEIEPETIKTNILENLSPNEIYGADFDEDIYFLSFNEKKENI